MVGFQIPGSQPPSEQPQAPAPAPAAGGKGKAAKLYRLIDSNIAYNVKPVIEKQPDGGMVERYYLDNGSGVSYVACVQAMSADKKKVHQTFFDKNGKQDGAERELLSQERDIAGSDKKAAVWVVLEETQWKAGVKSSHTKYRAHPQTGERMPVSEAVFDANGQVQEEKQFGEIDANFTNKAKVGNAFLSKHSKWKNGKPVFENTFRAHPHTGEAAAVREVVFNADGQMQEEKQFDTIGDECENKLKVGDVFVAKRSVWENGRQVYEEKNRAHPKTGEAVPVSREEIELAPDGKIAKAVSEKYEPIVARDNRGDSFLKRRAERVEDLETVTTYANPKGNNPVVLSIENFKYRPDAKGAIEKVLHGMQRTNTVNSSTGQINEKVYSTGKWNNGVRVGKHVEILSSGVKKEETFVNGRLLSSWDKFQRRLPFIGKRLLAKDEMLSGETGAASQVEEPVATEVDDNAPRRRSWVKAAMFGLFGLAALPLIGLNNLRKRVMPLGPNERAAKEQRKALEHQKLVNEKKRELEVAGLDNGISRLNADTALHGGKTPKTPSKGKRALGRLFKLGVLAFGIGHVMNFVDNRQALAPSNIKVNEKGLDTLSVKALPTHWGKEVSNPVTVSVAGRFMDEDAYEKGVENKTIDPEHVIMIEDGEMTTPGYQEAESLWGDIKDFVVTDPWNGWANSTNNNPRYKGEFSTKVSITGEDKSNYDLSVLNYFVVEGHEISKLSPFGGLHDHMDKTHYAAPGVTSTTQLFTLTGDSIVVDTNARPVQPAPEETEKQKRERKQLLGL